MDEPLGLGQQVIDVALDPVACVSRRTGVGGPAAPTHLAQLDEDVIELDQDQRRLDEVKAKVWRPRPARWSRRSTGCSACRTAPHRAPLTVGQSAGHASTCCG